MITIHDKAIRGHTRSGWLNSFHTFSFGSFNDPSRMGFGNLRVLNDDTIIPGSGFATHAHADMDILTYVLEGALRHEDDQGNVSVIGAGDAQMMSAGRGVTHSEWNASDADAARFLQIWLIPDRAGGAPVYAQRTVPESGEVLLAGPDGSGALLPLGSGTTVRLVHVEEGGTLSIDAMAVPHFVHLVDGLAYANDQRLSAGDGLQIPSGEATKLRWDTDGAALVFAMPPRQVSVQ